MSPGHYRACGIASTQGPSITCSLANWKTQWGLRKTNSCPLTRLRAFLHQGRLGIQMSCVFTSVMLASKAALHTLGWVQGKVIWSCCMGNTAGGLETQHSLMHEHHRDPRHAHSARGGNTAFHLLFPQRKHPQPQKQAQKSRLGTFHGKTLPPLPTCLLHWEMSPPNKSGWRDVCPWLRLTRSQLSVFACKMTPSRELQFLLIWSRRFSECTNRQRHKDMSLSATYWC